MRDLYETTGYFNPQTFKSEVGFLEPLGYTHEFLHQAVVDPIYVNVA